MAHHVIYIPGIGDTKTTFQELAVGTWRLWGVRPHTFAMRWADGKPYGPKFERLLVLIDELLSHGDRVSLVAASAGATVALNTFAERPQLNGVVLIAGKVNRAYAIGDWYKRHTPAFVQSAERTDSSVADLDKPQRARIMSRYGLVDYIVPKKDSYVPGAQHRRVVGIGHIMTIAFQLVFGAPLYIRFLRNLPVDQQ
jgi:pimeloyl-ACP methyl ester carboxylesterase